MTEFKKFSHYKALPESLKIIATQTAMWDFARKHGLSSPTATEHYIEETFAHDNQIVKQSLNSGFWRRKFDGQPLKNGQAFKQLSVVIKHSARILNHPLWSLLTTLDSKPETLDEIIQRLSPKVKVRLISTNEATKSFPLKQSYSSQRKWLYQQQTLDALTGLLLVAMNDMKHYKKGRSTEAEQLAFKLFFSLFTVVYPIKNREELAVLIDKRLCFEAQELHIYNGGDIDEGAIPDALFFNPDWFGNLVTKNTVNGVFQILEMTLNQATNQSSKTTSLKAKLTALAQLPDWDMKYLYSSVRQP